VSKLPIARAARAAGCRAESRRTPNPPRRRAAARIDGGGPASLGALPRGARVVLRASWRPEDAESYALFDVANQVITTRRESLRVSWFTTAGTYERDRSGRTEDEPETFTENTWTAPDEARTSHLSFVLRDSRGGVSFASVSATTR
jgi:hypothetical protein